MNGPVDTRRGRVTHRLMGSVAAMLVTIASVTMVAADEPPAAPATAAPAAPAPPVKLPQPSDGKAPASATSEGAAAAPPSPAAVIAHVSDHPVSFASLPQPRHFVTRHRMMIHGAPIA